MSAAASKSRMYPSISSRSGRERLNRRLLGSGEPGNRSMAQS